MRGAVAVLPLAFTLACAAPSPAPATPATTSGTAAAASTATEEAGAAAPAASSAEEQPSAAPAAPATPPEKLVLAIDSPPPGTQPLTDQEREEVKTQCKRLADALEASARKKKAASRAERDALLDELLAGAAKLRIQGIDVPRCAELMIRDVRAYRARSIESEAHATLGAIVVGLASALETSGQLCPSARPVPARLEALKNGPYSASPSDWDAAGWQCVGWRGTTGPQRFQYELTTDAKNGTFEVIARGYPVQGAPATELFTMGKVDGGRIQPTRQVWRRR